MYVIHERERSTILYLKNKVIQLTKTDKYYHPVDDAEGWTSQVWTKSGWVTVVLDMQTKEEALQVTCQILFPHSKADIVEGQNKKGSFVCMGRELKYEQLEFQFPEEKKCQ